YQAASGQDSFSIFNEPEFIDPVNFDFHLQQTSPAIDNGIDIGLTQDFDGNPVPQGLAPDIGAYEFDVSIGIDDLNHEIPNQKTQAKLIIYPNPTHGKCIIRLNHDSSSISIGNELMIYSISGVLIEKIKAKDNEFIWNNNSVPGGIYIIKLEGTEVFPGQRLLLVR
ncbi:MAG: T9SS type A sorting domain-containing protein, partial [Bacteroidetes bacterium]|nr:T9SS type A sorting domain-containing protein [Bacteroidota bacterium]